MWSRWFGPGLRPAIRFLAAGLLAACGVSLAVAEREHPHPDRTVAARGEVKRTERGEPVQVTVRELPDEEVEINAWIRIGDAHPDSVFAVVSDFEHLAAFMPNVERAKVVARTDSSVVVDQLGATRFIVRKEIHTVVEYVLGPRRLGFRALEGQLKRFDGFWSVTPARGDSVLVLFRAELAFDTELPRFLVRHAIGREFSRMMPAFATEVRRRWPRP